MNNCPHCGGKLSPPKPMPLAITPAQKRLLEAVRNYSARHGVAPSYDDLLAILGLKSKSGVYNRVKELVARGHIKYRPKHARSLTVISDA